MRRARAPTRVTYPWTDSGGCVECSRRCVFYPASRSSSRPKGAAMRQCGRGGQTAGGAIALGGVAGHGELLGAAHRHHIENEPTRWRHDGFRFSRHQQSEASAEMFPDVSTLPIGRMLRSSGAACPHRAPGFSRARYYAPCIASFTAAESRQPLLAASST